MKLQIDGNINPYYVQMLCMVFFPGAKFGTERKNVPKRQNDAPASEEDPETQTEAEGDPSLALKINTDENGTHAVATLTQGEKRESASYTCPVRDENGCVFSAEKANKLAAGGAVMLAGERLLGYRPAWGIMTGVRPAKLASDLMAEGRTPEEVRAVLVNDYFVSPKKAALATEVSLRENTIIGTPSMRDCSIYISIPFCPSRCAYCSFVSYTSKRLLSLLPEYLEMLIRDTQNILRMVKNFNLNLKSIYIGGGTPTILTVEQLKMLLSAVAAETDVGKLEEFTLESGRPDTITAEKFHVAKELGITRISVNPQTLSDEILHNIGRAHTTEDFLRAYEVARSSGISCINTDLIAGLPGDHFDNFYHSFDRILELHPENITVHTFCVKKAADYVRVGADVYSRQGGDAGKCVDYTQIKSGQAGYVPYYMYRQKNTVGNFENVGFSLPGKEGRYNVYMMEECHSIFAAGAGAVSKTVDLHPLSGNGALIQRFFNHKYPYEYLREPEFEKKEAFFRQFYEERGILESL